eukprot:scaffold25704_cov53-Phaeocystis_antarctica.AAC.1
MSSAVEPGLGVHQEPAAAAAQNVERGAAAGAGKEADAAGAGETRLQDRHPGLLCQRRGGSAVRRAYAGGAGGGGAACSGAATDGRGGAGAGAGGGADAAHEQDRLLRRRLSARPAQALSGAGDARWQARAPGQLRHRRGGGAMRRAITGGAGGGCGAGCSGGASDQRGGAAAGACRGADAGGGRQQDGLLWSARRQSRPTQALPGAGNARWQSREPGQLRHRRGGGAVRPALAGGTGGGGKGGVGEESGHAPCCAARRHPQGRGHSPAYAARRIPQGGGRSPAHAARCIRQGRGRRQAGGGLRWSAQEATEDVTIYLLLLFGEKQATLTLCHLAGLQTTH